ncbi:uncharacterized protein SCHCODRAFT_02164288 [Schizophyllum commune H4-8]|nr:uncharacterized protein SCHCODRAFT_02164288 [Schizophyllum commune H4-8]KAI5898402.1 hypothetical protein SCHCODRAFT_02164288 [Schizophyllum commune H4-8]
MAADNEEELALLSSTSGSDERSLTSLKAKRKPPRSYADHLLIGACICATVSSVLTLALFVLQTRSSSYTVSKPKVLRRISPYVNQERLSEVIRKHNMTFDPIVNVYATSFQMRAGDPTRALTEDTSREWASYEGLVWPYHRRFWVDGQTSTVMQFRNRDFGMERCVLVLSVPQQTPDLIPNVRLAEGSPISVWLLDPDAPELHPSISWGTAPRRYWKLATFAVSAEGNQTSEESLCAGDKFSTFEFECAEVDGCEVDFWQNKEKPFQGVRMIQHQSIL